MLHLLKLALNALLQYAIETHELPPDVVTWLQNVMVPVFNLNAEECELSGLVAKLMKYCAAVQ